MIIKSPQTTRNLPCILTTEELVAKRDKLVGRLDEVDRLEYEKKMAADKFKEQVANEAKLALELRREIRTRTEDRPTVCVEHADLDRRTLSVVRMDTGEVIHERKMNQSEHDAYAQQHMDMEADGTEGRA